VSDPLVCPLCGEDHHVELGEEVRNIAPKPTGAVVCVRLPYDLLSVVSSGKYGTMSETVRAALRLLRDGPTYTRSVSTALTLDGETLRRLPPL